MSNSIGNDPIVNPLKEAMDLLDLHYDAFFGIADIAEKTGHPVPMDTRGWSQILVSLIVGIRGVDRQKGPDLADGSDVKAANTWNAIDTPRFNGVLKAGTKALTSDEIASLDTMPHLYFVLWDNAPNKDARCRVWAVRTQKDEPFRDMAERWYEKKRNGVIRSDNFQLNPPRGQDGDVFRNTCGNLSYPKLFDATRSSSDESYKLHTYAVDVLSTGVCVPAV